ncbi:MAG: serine/threonine-protein kinase [Pyrobaculum sp.]
MSLVLLSTLSILTIGWAVYRSYIIAIWGIAAASIVLMSNDLVILFINSTLISLVVLAGIFERFKKYIIFIFVLATLAKMEILIEYYLKEMFTYTYYILDGIFTASSIYLMYIYKFRLRLNYITLPMFIAAVFSSTPTAAFSIIAGVVGALVEARYYTLILIVLSNIYFLYIINDISIFIPPLLFILSYILTYKRVLYLSKYPPMGWLYSWLGGRYKVINVLGAGGFSYVLAVRHKASTYAAKVLRYVDDNGAPLASDVNILRLFGQEMNRYIEIESDHVVKAYEVYLPTSGYRDVVQYIKNPPYILLEYMEGGTLRDLIRQKTRVDITQALEWFRQLAQGLYDIHKHNVVHLDIKPENIMFTKDKRVVKIGDMGIAKVVVGGYVKSSYMSPAYAAPEVKKGMATYKSDVYSLGCVYYEVLTGINPNVFVENGYTVPPPSVYNNEVPKWLDEIVLEMLNPDPSKRPSAADLVTYLNRNLKIY